MSTPSCPYCGQPREACWEPVDERFPAAARDALFAAGYDTVATCEAGQNRDVTRTGWCWDRARFSGGWTGAPLTPAERRGAGYAMEAW